MDKFSDIAKKSVGTSPSLTRRAFRDPSLQHQFDQDGYVVIPNFLDRSTMDDLESLYLKFRPGVNTGFHVTNWVKDDTYSIEAHKKVAPLLSAKLIEILDNYKPVLGCFAVKEPGFDNTMGLHQDWSLTDESRYYGISIWIPFVDVDEGTGAIKMLKGSHHLFSNIRGQKIKNQLDDLSPELVSKYLTTVPMKAGDLLVLHHRIVHSSGPSSHRRIAAMMAAIPQDAEVKHYLADTDDLSQKKLRVFNCPDDFYVTFDIDSPPQSALETEGTEQTEIIVTEAMIKDYYSI